VGRGRRKWSLDGQGEAAEEEILSFFKEWNCCRGEEYELPYDSMAKGRLRSEKAAQPQLRN